LLPLTAASRKFTKMKTWRKNSRKYIIEEKKTFGNISIVCLNLEEKANRKLKELFLILLAMCRVSFEQYE